MEIYYERADRVEREKLNDKRQVNKFLESVNRDLPIGGTFAGHVVCARERKAVILAKYPPVLNKLVYTADYAIHRVWPKLPYLRRMYFGITKGRGRVMAEMEAIGRLYACGFKLIASEKVGTELHFLAEKVGDPSYDMEATYGPLIKLKRVGRGGNIIKVYKFRTMSPYSEYIQGFIYEQNGYEGGTGFRDDRRITTVGKFMRKYWIDELPMLWNLFNGGLKLFGVRPVSRQYIGMFPDRFQEYRKRFKPGLIPPVYVVVPNSFDEIWKIEQQYLQLYEKNPIHTDLNYVGRALYNIFIKKVRSS